MDQIISSKSSGRMNRIIEMSEKRLGELNGTAGRLDIQKALRELDESGKPMTSVSVMIEYVDQDTYEVVRTVERINTIKARVDISGGADFATLKLEFENAGDRDKISIWNILERYGAAVFKGGICNDEVPFLSVISVPLLLGGKYALICADPVSWCIQPASAGSLECNQIRIDFHVEDTQFLYNPGFDMNAAVKQIRSEEISSAWEIQMRKAKEKERLAYRERMDKDVETMVFGNLDKHSFIVNDN